MTETPQQQPTPKPPPDHPHPPVQVFDSRMGAVLYNPFLWAGEKLGMARLRRRLLAEARGKVLENGMPRFFRRLAEGIFDEKDTHRTDEIGGDTTDCLRPRRARRCSGGGQ